MKPWMLVALGGALGAVLRYQITLWSLNAAEQMRFPVGTLLVNVMGCLAVGLLWGWTQRMDGWSEELRLALMVGLLGGFTTFSAFGLETVLMLRRGDIALAGFYSMSSLIAGLLAVMVGLALVGPRS